MRIALLFWMTASAAAFDDARLADAIWRAEGGHRARQPYGIETVKVRSHAHGRAICLRTIRTARSTWDGRTDFVEHLGRRYVPVEVDPTGHKNWVKNVKRLYR